MVLNEEYNISSKNKRAAINERWDQVALELHINMLPGQRCYVAGTPPLDEHQIEIRRYQIQLMELLGDDFYSEILNGEGWNNLRVKRVK